MSNIIAIRAQEENKNIYPYGGIIDTTRTINVQEPIPLNFYNANFDSLRFINVANFKLSKFYSDANFEATIFDSLANYWGTQFIKSANFKRSRFYNDAEFLENQFYGKASFWESNYYGRANFMMSRFDSIANFKQSKFQSTANFENVNFDEKTEFQYSIFMKIAYFNQSRFISSVNFYHTKFDSVVIFNKAYFKDFSNFSATIFLNNVEFKEIKFLGQTDFRNSQFNATVDFKGSKFSKFLYFNGSKFNKLMNFSSCIFDEKIDFRNVKFDSFAIVDFSLAEIKDTIFVGNLNSREIQRYDFMKTKLLEKGETINYLELKNDTIPVVTKYPGANIIIYAPVDLKIQLEKFKFIKLCDSLDFYTKKDIITTLKDVSFSENKKHGKERFELEYILAKSTINQKKSSSYKKYGILNPITWIHYLHNITMGLGYRPFRLACWALIIVFIFTIIYFFKMNKNINNYLAKRYEIIESLEYRRGRRKLKNRSNPNLIDSLINCLYFSSMLFFSFRFKTELLTFFNTKEKQLILIEWLMGFFTYIAFFTLSKSGSILHNLKSLFLG